MTGVKRGFDLSHDPASHILTVRFRGFWDVAFAHEFANVFQDKVNDLHANGNAWRLLLDFTKCAPQSQEVQAIISAAIRFAKEAGMQKQAMLANGSIMSFQSNCLSDLQVYFYFQAEDDAMRWLANPA